MNMAEKVRSRCSDGVVIEADKKVMSFASTVVRDVTDVANADIGTIPLQDTSSLDLKRVITACEVYYDLLSEINDVQDSHLLQYFREDSRKDWPLFPDSFTKSVGDICGDILESQKAGMTHIESALKSQPETDELPERIREEVEFDVGTFITQFTNQSCARFDWEAIKSMHKVHNHVSPASFYSHSSSVGTTLSASFIA